MTKINDKRRMNPITFRFPRGTSGRELADKYNAVADYFRVHYNCRTSGDVLRKCIEESYTLYCAPPQEAEEDLESDDLQA